MRREEHLHGQKVELSLGHEGDGARVRWEIGRQASGFAGSVDKHRGFLASGEVVADHAVVVQWVRQVGRQGRDFGGANGTRTCFEPMRAFGLCQDSIVREEILARAVVMLGIVVVGALAMTFIQSTGRAPLAPWEVKSGRDFVVRTASATQSAGAKTKRKVTATSESPVAYALPMDADSESYHLGPSVRATVSSFFDVMEKSGHTTSWEESGLKWDDGTDAGVLFMFVTLDATQARKAREALDAAGVLCATPLGSRIIDDDGTVTFVPWNTWRGAPWQ